jgi:DNA polymerase-4
MHIDLNSCFASVEQQANPLLRYKPVAVVHTDAPYGCILAPSVEAKLWGVKTGMTLSEGRERCPILLSRQADPPKYREVHHRFATLLSDYAPHPLAKSIDEFVLTLPTNSDQAEVVREIKSRIKKEIGDYLRVSVGISTNQNLAKLASGLHKPDGFDVINHTNFLDIYNKIELMDFCGINTRNEARLHKVGVFTPLQFYQASRQTLRSAFQSVLGDYWHARLRGYEVDDVEFQTRSYGQSYVLPHPMDRDEWYPIMAKLVSKAGRRMRRDGYSASATHISLRYSDHTSYKLGHKLKTSLQSDHDLIAACSSLTLSMTNKKVKKVAVTLFGIGRDDNQESLFIDKVKEKRLVTALDGLNTRYGDYTISYASLMGSAGHVRDAIAFGKA